MISWWDSLSVAAQVFALIAIPSTLVLVIQTVLMLIGIGIDNADADGIELDNMFADHDTEVDGVFDHDTEVDGVFDHDTPDGDIDPSGLDSLRLFTLRGIIAFLVVFGWVGYVMESANIVLPITLLVSAVCGFAMMTLLALLIRTIMKLRNDGNIDNRNAVGVSAKVYLTVPAKRKGEGKINVMIQGSYVEREAVTDEAEDIPTGCEVVVTGVSGQTTLVVMKK